MREGEVGLLFQSMALWWLTLLSEWCTGVSTCTMFKHFNTWRS